jgi:hypothetical protein
MSMQFSAVTWVAADFFYFFVSFLHFIVFSLVIDVNEGCGYSSVFKYELFRMKK